MPSPIRYTAAERNKQPIFEVLQRVILDKFGSLDSKLQVLEVGSSTGQHLSHFASKLPSVEFQPTDKTSELFHSINAYREREKLSNLRQPMVLDLTWPEEQWPAPSTYDLLYCSNITHISPWPCTVALFGHARQVLKPGTGYLFLYGPFAKDGVLTPESNVHFDRHLRSMDPEWGVRDTRDINRLAEGNGLTLESLQPMPANNMVLLFRNQAS